jgi:cytochrome c oxidase subunit II
MNDADPRSRFRFAHWPGAAARGVVGAYRADLPKTAAARRSFRPHTGCAAAVVALGSALLAVLAASVLADAAVAGPITPDAGESPNAQDIDTLYRLALYIGIVVFVIVEGTLIWTLRRYRRRRGGTTAAQIRGNTPLEIGWTVAAVLILVVLTAVTFVYLDDIKDPPGARGGTLTGGAQFATIDQDAPPSGARSLTIEVSGQQYIWRFVYPGEEQLYSFHTMVVPTDTTIVLRITSSDVIHSWWIPQLGGKADAVPGHVNQTWFRVEKTGTFRGPCAELCGYNHADMRAEVRVVSRGDFRRWAEAKRRQIAAAGRAVARQRPTREDGLR